ncbi:FecR family protein [Henriciella aquimarina]|uniref:FecR family protein n=1 Tax=Henriciella aquimarina TaxID=545261 RepID=UPI001301AE1C|nr:FecR domain-containing protein [Henriciella aquimarina]
MGVSKTEEELEREAAAWFTRLHSGDVDASVRADFEAWLHHDRAHKAAYREFEQVYRDLDLVAPEAGVDLDSLLGRRRFRGSALTRFIQRPAGAIAGAGIAMALTVALLFAPSMLESGQGPSGQALAAKSSSLIATSRGEIREVRLEDGSVVTLGAKSRIETEFTPSTRKIDLLDGEVFLEVAKDADRPFFVTSQDTLVRVTGTKFDVKRSADIVHVSVLEGVVEVMKPADIPAAIEQQDVEDIEKQVLTKGERVSAARRVALPEVKQIEQVEPGAWREGRLAYEDASLAEIIADLNRYSDRQIEIASSDVGDMRSTVAFRVDNMDQVFDVLEAIHPLTVSRPAAGPIVISRKR